MCCNPISKLSFNERVQYYISKKKEIEAEYKSRMEALNKEASADILTNCPIKVGDVYVSENNNGWSGKRQYYKVAKLDARADGSVIAYGYKRKLDKTWGKRDNIFIFVASICDDFNIKEFTKVEDYVEPIKN